MGEKAALRAYFVSLDELGLSKECREKVQRTLRRYMFFPTATVSQPSPDSHNLTSLLEMMLPSQPQHKLVNCEA